MADELSNLHPVPGAQRPRTRIGRGQGSGLGKTAGAGTKGQQARGGYSRAAGFEGGQVPLKRRLPKRGFNNIFAKEFAVVNLGRVQQFIDAGKIDASQPITTEALFAANVVGKAKEGIRLLAKGVLTTKASFVVEGASASAVAAVEGLGGTVTLPAVAAAAE
jgi:large subunit ribosomal protein L15